MGVRVRDARWCHLQHQRCRSGLTARDHARCYIKAKTRFNRFEGKQCSRGWKVCWRQGYKGKGSHGGKGSQECDSKQSGKRMLHDLPALRGGELVKTLYNDLVAKQIVAEYGRAAASRARQGQQLNKLALLWRHAAALLHLHISLRQLFGAINCTCSASGN